MRTSISVLLAASAPPSPPAAEISVGPQSMLCIITVESRPGLASILPQMKPVPRTPPWKRVALLPLSGLRGHDYGTLRFKRNPKLRSLKGVGGVQSCLKAEVDVAGGESCTDHSCLVKAGLFEQAAEGVGEHREM